MPSMKWEEFLKYAQEFEAKSNKLLDGWKLKKINYGDMGEIYLYKRIIKLTSVSEMTTEYISGTSDEDGEPYSVEVKRVKDPLIWEYHIVYSPSYSVPVLYFNLYDKSGKRLGHEETLNYLKLESEQMKNINTIVSQVEHPLLRVPYYYLHPCHTSELLVNSKGNALITWLSSIAYIVNLKLSLDYAL
jgi:ubiquitin-like-conjugating enzyme ATG10